MGGRSPLIHTIQFANRFNEFPTVVYLVWRCCCQELALGNQTVQGKFTSGIP